MWVERCVSWTLGTVELGREGTALRYSREATHGIMPMTAHLDTVTNPSLCLALALAGEETD